MAVNWKTPLQSLMTALNVSDATRTTQQWLTLCGVALSSPPYAGLTWGSGAAGADKWGVAAIIATLQMYGPIADDQILRFGISDVDSLLLLVVNQANIALGAGPPFTGPPPANLRVGAPWV